MYVIIKVYVCNYKILAKEKRVTTGNPWRDQVRCYSAYKVDTSYTLETEPEQSRISAVNMGVPLFSWYSVLLTAASLLFFFFVWRREKKTRNSLPPGPTAWPIVGNLFQLGNRPTESLYALSLEYGPLMTLRLGTKTTVVVSSAAMAKEVFKTHDHIFAGRTVIEGVKSISHHKASLIWGEYGAHWRNLRRISMVELFSNTRQEALRHLRRAEVFHTIRLIYEDKGNVIDIGRRVFCTSLNLLGNMIFSSRVFDPHNPASAGFNHSVCELTRLGGKPNLVDFFPFLRLLDPQGVCSQMSKHLQAMYDFVDLFLQKRLASESENLGRKDNFNFSRNCLLPVLKRQLQR